MSIDLTTIWAFIIAFAVFMYVVMDGFDLGIGILFPSFKPGHERSQAMNAIAPVWDGNETWLVLGGGGLMAAFPLAYAIILPATYPLIIFSILTVSIICERAWNLRNVTTETLQLSGRICPPLEKGDPTLARLLG